MKTARFSVILLLAALVNCTEKGKPVVTHDGDRRQAETQPATQIDPAGEVRANSFSLTELAARVLAESRIRDLKSYNSRAVHDELLSLNDQILKTPAAERAKLLPILKNYVAALDLECTDIKASCLGLKYFRTAGSSAEVAKMAAQMPEFENCAARLLLLAVEMKNGLTDNSLLRLLVEKVPPADATVRSLLETALMGASENIRDAAKLREFLIAVKAWELAGNERWMLSASAQSALWSMIARARLIYEADGKLSPEFAALAEKLNKQPGSFAFEQKKLLDHKTIVPQAMGVQPVLRLDELYFLTDAVFMQKISPQAAAELFLSSRRSPQDLAAAVDNYVRMRFVIGVADANAAAKEIFMAAVPTEQLLIHALRQSSLIKQIWGTLNLRLGIVKTFASSALKKSAGGDPLEARLRATFNSFGRSVNMVSVYPHTLLLFQLLSQKRFKIYLRGLGDVDTGNLMPMIYYGTFPPLLDYSDEPAALNHFEILHAFDMAVRSRMFAAMGIDPDEFMADVLSRLNQNPAEFIRSTLDTIENRFNESRHFRTLENICRELKGGPAMPRTLDLEGVRSSAYLGGMMNSLFLGVTSRGSRSGGSNGALDSLDMGLFYADAEYGEALERVRLDITQYERVADAMLTSYTGYLKKYEGASDSVIAKRTAKTRAQLGSLAKLRTRAMTTASKWFEQFGWCYYKVAQKDFDLMNSVIKTEEEHLRSVYRDMKRLREGNLSEEQKRQITAGHQLNGLPGDFKGLDRIDKDAYTMSSIDFLIRAGLSVHNALPNVSINFGSRLDLDVDLVRGATIRQIPFGPSEELFVDGGLRAIFAKQDPFVVWQSLAGGRIVMWQNLMKVMMTGYRLEGEVTGSAKTFTPERIFEAHEDLVRLTVLTPDDRRILGVLHEDERIDPLFLSDRLLMYTVDVERGKFAMQDIWSLYDMPVIFANYEKLGYDYDFSHMGPEQIPEIFRPKRYGYMELGRLYYNARSSWIRGTPMIPYNPDLDRELDEKVTATVREGIRATKAFHKAALAHIAEVSKLPPAQRPRADINMHQSITSFLSDNLIPSYDADIALFRQSTQSCFVKKCPDFK
jgi:hypothetical protein